MSLRRPTFAIATLLVLVSGQAPVAAQSAVDLARAALEKQKGRPFWLQPNGVLLRYIGLVYETSATRTELDADGRIKKQTSWRQDVVPVEGVSFVVLLAEHGVPVEPARQADLERRNQERFAHLQRRPAAEKARDRAAFERRRAERDRFWDEFARAFRFELVNEPRHHDRPAIVVGFRPDPSYRPRGIIDTEYLPKIAGRLCIDQQDVELVHLELEFIKDYRIGFGVVGSIRRGTKYSMELAKQGDDQWLPKRAATDWHVRKLVAASRERLVVDYGRYRRFSVDAKWLAH